MKNKKVLTAILLVLLLLVLGIVYLLFSSKTSEGIKKITVTVVDDAGARTDYSCKTDAQYLADAMKELEKDGLTFSGTESSQGVMVDTVNGLKADYNENGAYWCFYANGEMCVNGISVQPIQDGDEFEIVYTKAE